MRCVTRLCRRAAHTQHGIPSQSTCMPMDRKLASLPRQAAALLLPRACLLTAPYKTGAMQKARGAASAALYVAAPAVRVDSTRPSRLPCRRAEARLAQHCTSSVTTGPGGCTHGRTASWTLRAPAHLSTRGLPCSCSRCTCRATCRRLWSLLHMWCRAPADAGSEYPPAGNTEDD